MPLSLRHLPGDRLFAHFAGHTEPGALVRASALDRQAPMRHRTADGEVSKQAIWSVEQRDVSALFMTMREGKRPWYVDSADHV
jgi:hypothetical protein